MTPDERIGTNMNTRIGAYMTVRDMYTVTERPGRPAPMRPISNPDRHTELVNWFRTVDWAACTRDQLLKELCDAGAVYVRAYVGRGEKHWAEYVRVHKGEFVELVKRHGPRVVYSVKRSPGGDLYVG